MNDWNRNNADEFNPYEDENDGRTPGLWDQAIREINGEDGYESASNTNLWVRALQAFDGPMLLVLIESGAEVEMRHCEPDGLWGGSSLELLLREYDRRIELFGWDVAETWAPKAADAVAVLLCCGVGMHPEHLDKPSRAAVRALVPGYMRSFREDMAPADEADQAEGSADAGRWDRRVH